MNDAEVKRFYASRVPLSGRLSDYALLIGQNNRVTQFKSYNTTDTGPIAIPANPNRVCLVITANTILAITNGRAFAQIVDDAGKSLLDHLIYDKQVPTALITATPLTYTPLFLNVADHGPIVQQRISVTSTNGFLVVYVVETTMIPSCCKYLSQNPGG